MDLKTFKEGVEYLARSTNQREKEPAPFLIQIGKDGGLSLVSGDRDAMYIWRTGIVTDAPALREGISSKMLVQTTKTLKGKDLTLRLYVFDNAFIVETSKGGKVRMPFIEGPDIMPPRFGGAEAHVTLEEGRLAEIVKGIDATAEGELTRGVQFHAQGNALLLISSESHKCFTTHLTRAEVDRNARSGKWGTRAAFWNALRGATTNAELTFFQSGLHVHAGDFEAYSKLWNQPVYDIREKYFPEGVRPEIYVVTDRKVLLGSIKAVTPDQKNGTVDMAQTAEGGFFISRGKEHVGMPRAKGKGWGHVGFSAEYMTDILNAMNGKEVILAWHENDQKPIGIKDASRQGDTFILAPRMSA